MATTVDDLRDEIRVAVGRYERVESTAFTKEALAAICEALDREVDADRLPAKLTMRAEVLDVLDLAEGGDDAGVERPFRKAELAAIAAALSE